MKIRKIINVSIIGMILVSLTALHAEWKVSESDSRIGFTAFSRMHDVDGSFEKWTFSGKISDSLTGKGTATIMTSSVNTGKIKRDRHLRNEDFFNTPVYSQAIYKISNISRMGNKVIMKGVFTLLGKERALNITLDATQKDNTMILSGSKVIKRSDFGMDFNSNMNPIQDNVKLNFKIVLNK